MPKQMPKPVSSRSDHRVEPYPTIIKPGNKHAKSSKKTPPGKAVLGGKSCSAINAASNAPTEDSTEKLSSFPDIKLEGEDEGDVEVYDTCSTVRQKINALLGKDNAKPENAVPGQFKKDGTPKPYTKAEYL